MSLIADILLTAATIGAALYCLILSQRLRRFTDLERGVGGAVAVLSAQVDDLSRMLKAAQGNAAGSVTTLNAVTARAEQASVRLELLMSSLHDLPEPDRTPAARAPAVPVNPFFVRHPEGVDA